ncbi:MAG TPA: glutamate ABC transporter substrate-binding protein [Microbacteriaceae bacterium]|nr:glutamate ABC transporter substrate-binding protein [Microbacteriaceae bacterium]
MTSSRTLALAILLTSAALITGCASPSVPGGSGNPGSGSTGYDDIVASAPVASAAEIEANPWARAVRDAGVLRVGGTDLARLWSLKDPTTGKLEGFDAGLSQMLSRYILGEVHTELTPVSVDTRETLLQNHAVDAVFATYSITPKREAKVDFAGPYYQSGASILVRSDTTNIRDVADLAGKTVVTQSNSTGVTALREHAPDAHVVTFPDNVQCVSALTQRRVDAYVIDESILLSNAVSTPGLKVVGTPFTSDPYGIGLPKESGAKAFVNQWLSRIIADGSWARLWKATIGTVVEGSAPTPPVPVPAG